MDIIYAVVSLKDRILKKMKLRASLLVGKPEENMYREAYMSGYMHGVNDAVETMMVSMAEDQDTLH